MADNIINVKLKQRYDTENNWANENPILLSGEMAISSDKDDRYKIGNGTSKWSELSYAKARVEKSDLGLNNVDNTADADKSVKYATSAGNADTVNKHTVNADVPSGAKFTDTVYTHPTTSGNKHIPSGGSSGQILRWSSDGTAVWGSDNNTTYSNFVKSGSGAKAGLVPAPSTTAGTTKYLREDGTWTIPPDTNTTYSVATTSSNGLMSSSDKIKLDGLALMTATEFEELFS